jgi:hypothetical protein
MVWRVLRPFDGGGVHVVHRRRYHGSEQSPRRKRGIVDFTQGMGIVGSLCVFLLVALVAVKLRRRSHRGGAFGPGPGLVGAYDGFQTRERQQAMELIVEERAAEKSPEYPTGNLPELENPRRE